MNIYQPFTYLIKFKPTGQVYYGVRYARKCNPSQLWTKYFTTSKIIKQLIKEYGISAFEFQIRHVFNTKESAVLWESKILKRFNAATNPLWLNQNNGDRKFVGSRIWTDQQKQILSQKLTGRTISTETRAKIGAANTGKTHTVETNAKLSVARKGKPLSAEHRAKISASSKVRPPVSDETRAKISAAKRKNHKFL